MRSIRIRNRHGRPEQTAALANGENSWWDGRLAARLERPVPKRLPVGRGNAFFVYGSCFDDSRRIRDLKIRFGDIAVPALGFAMPRNDNHFQGLPYRSAFWTIVPVDAEHATGPTAVEVHANFDGDEPGATRLAEIEVVRDLERNPTDLTGGVTGHDNLVAICMATYNPPIELFEMQIDSIRRQSHPNWICLISDDRSSPRKLSEMTRVIGGDPHFVLSSAPHRLGHYSNFERALTMVPTEATYVAFADQDDRWYPEKLRTLISELGDSSLIYSDMRVVDQDGFLVSETFWNERRNNYTDLMSLLVANTVTGAASLFRRELLDYALPFPPFHGGSFHDHWLGLVALAAGKIAYVDAPLYDYVQHGRAAHGHAAANASPGPERPPLVQLRPPRIQWTAPFVAWRTMHFGYYCRLRIFAEALRLRIGAEMAPGERRQIDRFLDTHRSLRKVAWLALRPARAATGRKETLGLEGELARAAIWPAALKVATARRKSPGRRVPNDAGLPPVPTSAIPAAVRMQDEWRTRLSPLPIDVRRTAPTRINVFVSTIDLDHFFGAYIAAFNMARRLAEHGLRVRIVTVDSVPALHPGWRAEIRSYAGLERIFDQVEVEFGRDFDSPIEVSPDDQFIATTSWTAHVAHRTARNLGRHRFVHVIQEYDPLVFPVGSYAAMSAEAYRFPQFAVFSTDLLRDYFRRHRIGVYSASNRGGDHDSATFFNAITDISEPSKAQMRSRTHPRLLFYARPEQHAARNMFELGTMGLSDAVEEGILDPAWEINGVGSLATRHSIDLGRDARLEVLPRRDQAGYARLLARHDVGLALMHTPHPSLVPIEMASAGLSTVTTTFENKTAPRLERISENLIAAEPTREDITAALSFAVSRVTDFDARARGAAVDWPTNWDEALPGSLLDRINEFLRAC